MKNKQLCEKIDRMYRRYRKNFPGILEVEAAEALRLAQAENVVFIDIRNSDEQDIAMLPNAITEDTFLSNRERYNTSTVIAYCTVGYRSGKFVKRHQSAEHANLFNLKGGILAWLHAGGTLFDRNGATRCVHVYGPKWALQPSSYEAVLPGSKPY